MPARKVVWVVVITIWCLSLLPTLQSEDARPPAGPDQSAPPAPVGNANLVGSGSCSARGCHGGPQREDPAPGRTLCLDEYPRWLLHDRHASAYDVLFNQRSVQIAKNLNIVKAHEAARCLACHTNPRAAKEDAGPLLVAERSFGVGCESCHGGAKQWLGPHTTKAWRSLSVLEKQENHGMVDLTDLRARAKMCAGCHLGSPPHEAGDYPARDMNHDLIAAGHPALNFEFSAFTANMPPHWSVKLKKKDVANTAQAWMLGQLASAETACDLLAYRAGSKERPKDFATPWPEFSEFNCSACHHDLQPRSWRQARGDGPRHVLGSPSWGTWHLAMPEALAHQEGKKPLLDAVRQVRAEMSKPSPNKSLVAGLAKALRKELGEWKTPPSSMDYPPEQVRSMLKQLADHEANSSTPNWEGAAQLYLGVRTLNRALPKPDQRIEESLKTLYQKLAFPPSFDSHREMDAEGFQTYLKKLAKEVSDAQK